MLDVSEVQQVTYLGTVPNSPTLLLGVTLRPFHVFEIPRRRRSPPVALLTSTAGARSFLGAWCDREKRLGIAWYR